MNPSAPHLLLDVCRRLIWGTIVVLAASVTSPTFAEGLNAPVDVSAQRAHHIGRLQLVSGECPRIGPLPTEVSSVGFYSDPQYSKVDPEKLKEFRAATQTLRDAEEALSVALSDFVAAASDNSTSGACIVGILKKFASQKAMLETTEFRGKTHVRLFAVTPAFSYALIRDRIPISRKDADLIEGWLRQLAENIVRYEQEQPQHNNIRNWAAAALAVSAAALQERRFLGIALTYVRQAAQDVTPEGLLPAEMARGDRALEYSLFATQALAVVMAVAEQNGIDEVRRYSDGAIERLMKRMARSVIDRPSFVALSNRPNAVSSDYVYEQNMAWTALARRFIRDEAITEVYCRFRPLNNFRAGGRWETFFGEPGVCK